jgi:ATP synthase protein I
MLEPEDKARLDALSKRIEAAKGPGQPGSKVEEHHSQTQAGWRMVTELVTGLLIGFGIGFGLDKVLGTLPIFLVLFTLLGFAAGVRVMMRTAAEMQRTGTQAAADAAGHEGK